MTIFIQRQLKESKVKLFFLGLEFIINKSLFSSLTVKLEKLSDCTPKMQMKRKSLEEHARQSQSIRITQTDFTDYIDEQVKENQISQFVTLTSCSLPLQKNNLKQLNSNQQSKKATGVEKSTLESGEAKLYKERVQILESRLKQKCIQLKNKEEQISSLITRNQQLQREKLETLFQFPQKINHSETNKEVKGLSPIEEEYIIPVPKYLPEKNNKLSRQFSINYHSILKNDSQDIPSHFKLEIIQLRSELQRYKRKYLVIQQNLKRRSHDHQIEISTLVRKVKEQKQLTERLREQIFSLQEENIDLKQKLQEAFQEIEHYEQLQRETLNNNNLEVQDQNQSQRFSFGNQFPSIDMNSFKEQKNQLFSISSQVNQCFRNIPEHNKKSQIYIRLYPRMYELSIRGKRRVMGISSSLNMKVDNPSKTLLKGTKKHQNLKICPKQVSYQKKIKSDKMKVIFEEKNMNLVDKKDFQIQEDKASQNRYYRSHTINSFIEKREQTNSQQNLKYQNCSQSKEISVKEKRNISEFASLNSKIVSNTMTPSQNKDIVFKINSKLGNNIKVNQDKKQSLYNSDNYSTSQGVSKNGQISIQQRFRKEALNIQCKPQSNCQCEEKQYNPMKRNDQRRQYMLKPKQQQQDQNADDILNSASNILSKYQSSNRSMQLVYHQNLNSFKPQQTEIQNRSLMQKSNSIQNLHHQKLTISPQNNQKGLERNMSLNSLGNHKLPLSTNQKLSQSYLKQNNLTINRNQNSQSPLHSKTQQANRLKNNVQSSPYASVQTPSRQSLNKVSSSMSMKDLIAQKCKKLTIN